MSLYAALNVEEFNMTAKLVFAPHLKSNVRLGGVKAPTTEAKMKLKDYLVAGVTLPTPPTSQSWTAAAQAALVQMYLNNSLGDCVIAGGYHDIGVWTGNAGDIFVASSAQITADYSAIGGYVPGQPSTDNGCDEQTALTYWTSHGFADGSKLAGWLAVDATNQQEMELALYLFENLFFGMALPDAWISPFPSTNGFIWDVAGNPDPNNGHCVIGCGYTTGGVTIDSWGLLGTLTWKAAAKYAVLANGGELYVLLSPDQIAKGQTLAPNGFNWTQLITDLNAMGANIPVPTPAPTPTPPVPTPPTPTPPTPTPPVPAPPAPPAPTVLTLAEVTNWAISGLKTHGFLITPTQAEQVVTTGLAANWPTSK